MIFSNIKRRKTCTEKSLVGQNDPFFAAKIMENLADGRFGSLTKEFEELHAEAKRIRAMLNAFNTRLSSNSKSAEEMMMCNSKNLMQMVTETGTLGPEPKLADVPSSVGNPLLESKDGKKEAPIIIIDSDDETESPAYLPIQPYSNGQLSSQDGASPRIDGIDFERSVWEPSIQYEKVSLTSSAEQSAILELEDQKCDMKFSPLSFKKLISKSTPKPQNNKGVKKNESKDEHLGSKSMEQESYPREAPNSPELSEESEVYDDSESSKSSDGLDDLWNDMSLALECSKDTTVHVVPPAVHEEEEECDHSYILKDDLGLVCCICGIIRKSIENIFDYQWTKGPRAIGNYLADSRSSKGNGSTISFSELKSHDEDMLASEIAIHPRHAKFMKSHQLEGFNFLVRNLVAEKPGGCILAHAPGSGKTFVIISFIQSFLAQYPLAKPLIVLPKGILSTWQREFQKWQVEKISLLDFYSVKADSRSQQLEVLNHWMEEKSILFLGYKQFANIVCGTMPSNDAAACQNILLTAPSLLIIDEGHTPRNDNTDIVESLGRVETPRKVVLSGTLYQNHVKEVFNILKLVRPKFLKMDSSRGIVRRILSRVQISGGRKQCRADNSAQFFELVEDTLQNDPDYKRKVKVIQDLREMTKDVLHYYKGDFLDELPGLSDFTVVLKLSSKQKEFVDRLGKMDKFKKSSVCSAIYIHPKLREMSESSGGDKGCVLHDEKIDNIIDQLNVMDGVKTKFFLNILSMSESAGEKVIVFSQYLLPLKFLERLLARMKGWRPGKEMFTISGDSGPEQRETAMEQLNNSPDAKILFGSIKACGEGISLVGASRVIILDVHLNPSVSRQAIGRAFRPGQTKKVYVYRLVAANSAEEEYHRTSFRKELTAKMWFEWSEYRDDQGFKLDTLSVEDSDDLFFQNSNLIEDVTSLYER